MSLPPAETTPASPAPGVLLRLFTRPAVPWIALGISVLMAVSAWVVATQLVEARTEERFEARTEALKHSIASHMLAGQAILESTQGLFAASNDVTRSEFSEFVESLELETYFAGVQGIGFAKRLRPDELAAHEAAVRAEGFPQYEVHPQGDRAEYTSIVFLEPFTGRNLRAFGYDMFSEAVRREAMEKARDTGVPALSGGVRLVQETDREVQTGILLYVPVYRNDRPHVTLEQRRENLLGWVYSPYRLTDLIRGALGRLPDDVDLEIYDGTPSPASLLFDSGPPSRHFDEATPLFQRDLTLVPSGQRPWTLRFHSRAAFTGVEARLPGAVALFGLVSNLLFLASLLAARRQHDQALGVEQALARAREVTEANFRTFFESSPALVFVLDPDGRLVDINPMVTQRLGYTLDELKGKSLLELHPPERRTEATEVFGAMVAGLTSDCHIPLLTKTGGQMPVETRVVRTTWNGAPAFIGTSHDISELKLSQEKFSQVFHGNPIPMAVSSLTTGIYVDVNEAFLQQLGYRRDEVVGKSSRTDLNIFAREEQRAGALKVMKETGRLRDYEVDVRCRDGSVRVGLFSAHAIPLQPEPLLLTMMVDVTERRRAEQALVKARNDAESANRAKSAFLAMMSHEIRTPMNGVLGLADLLESTPLNAEQRQFLATMRAAGSQLLSVIEDVIDFSRLEAGAMRFEPQPFDPTAVAREVVELLHANAESKGITLSLVLPTELPGQVLGDGRRVRQVLTNLVGNAVKFTVVGGVTVQLFWRPEAHERGTLRFEVKDTGIGISPEAQAKLFQVFSQADSSTARRFGGSGLGLAISRRIVEGMGGTLELTSADGQGSTFWFELPLPVTRPLELPVVAPPPGVRPSAPRPAPVASLAGRVLLAEDNPINRRVAQKMLQNAGLTVDLAEDGRQALEHCQAGHYDAVLMDMQMPGMDGVEATQRIREVERSTGAHVPIIALTANALPEDRRACFTAGMDDFLSKPLHQDRLVATLTRWLGRAPADEAPPGDFAALALLEAVRLDEVARLLEVEPRQALAMALGSATVELAGLTAALSRADTSAAVPLARVLWGTCTEVGATRLAALARALELAAAQGQQAEADALRKQAEGALRDLEAESMKLAPPPVARA